MTQPTLLESGLAPPSPEQGTVNTYAQSMVSLLTRGNPERAIGEAIDHLIEQRAYWEANEQHQSNEVLYGMLQHCYMLNNAMIGSDGMAKNLRKGLGSYIDSKGHKFTEATPLITKIIRCVFGVVGVDRRRVNAYATALRVAMQEKVAVMSLPKYLRDSGGIEEVRRKSAKPTKTLKDKVALGRAVLSTSAIASITSDSLTAAYSTTSTEEGVVLLATREDDGSFAIRQVVQSNTAIKTALAACASVGAEKEKARQVEQEFQAIEDERAAAQAALRAA